MTDRPTGPENKRIVVVGASSGIGAALISELADNGNTIFAGARRQDRLETVCAGVDGCSHAVLDAADAGSTEVFFEKACETMGGVDAIVCCAGSYGTIGAADTVSPQDWISSIQNNLGAAFLTHRFGAPILKRTGVSPSMVFFAGGGAFDPLPRYSAYAVSKAGIVRFMETVAVELYADGIMVNAVAPGFVDTEIHQATLEVGPEAAGEAFYEMTLGRIAEGSVPIETPVACVRYLLSTAANGLSGKTLSASFDPWSDPAFSEHADALTESALYRMQRVNLVHLPDDPLAREIAALKEKTTK